MIKANEILNKELLHHLFVYKNGELVWRVNKRKSLVNCIAGCVDKYGYRRINIKCKTYYAHHLVWIFHNGTINSEFIDHINHKKSDNRIENLRLATILDNNRNASLCKGTNPFNGVRFDKRGKSWKVYIKERGIDIHLGYFKQLEEAISMRLTANDHYGYHKNHGT